VSLVEVVVLAVVQGAAEVLPVSSTGHAALARMWLGAGREAAAVTGALHLATAAAVALAARQRIGAAIGEGVRAIARPGLLQRSPGAWDAALILAGSAVSLATSAALRPFVALWAEAPIAVGLGLVITGAALGSTAIAPRPSTAPDARSERPPLAGMVAAGLVHGLGMAPGASRMGAALVVLLWLGVTPARALDLALAITAPALVAEGLRVLAAPALGADVLVAGLLVAFACASAAALGLRALVERRLVGALCLWVIPLGLATVAYARALPGFALALDFR